MNWTKEIELDAALMMSTGRIIINQHKGVIAQTYRQKPTEKSVQEGWGKVVQKGHALITAKGLEDKVLPIKRGKKRPAADIDDDEGSDAEVPDNFTGGIISGRKKRKTFHEMVEQAGPTPQIRDDQPVFSGFPVTWSQLTKANPELVDQVKKTCEGIKKDLDEQVRAEKLPGLIEMHKRNLTAQRMAEMRPEERAARDGLVSMTEGGGEYT